MYNRWLVNIKPNRPINWHSVLLWVIYLLVALIFTPAYAIDREQHKATLLGYLPNYVKWPEAIADSESSSFNICILGENTFKGFLESLYNHKFIKNKPIKIYYIDTIEDSSDCHLLFISLSKRKRISEILAFIKGKPILTISEIRGFVDKRGIIQFYMKSQKVHLKINNQAAIEQGLKISSKLLAITR